MLDAIFHLKFANFPAITHCQRWLVLRSMSDTLAMYVSSASLQCPSQGCAIAESPECSVVLHSQLLRLGVVSVGCWGHALFVYMNGLLRRGSPFHFAGRWLVRSGCERYRLSRTLWLRQWYLGESICRQMCLVVTIAFTELKVECQLLKQ